MEENGGVSGLQQLEEKVGEVVKGVEDKAADVVKQIEAELQHLETEAKAEFDAAKAAVVAVEQKVVKCFQAVFGFALHDPTQGVTVSPTDPTEAVHTEWIQGQIDAGTIVEVAK